MAKYGLLLIVCGLLVHCFLTPMANGEEEGYPRYKDPKQPINKRIRDLMERMTLEEKIGQMTLIERTVATDEVLQKYSIGSVLSGGGSAPAEQASPEQWIDMVNNFQMGSLNSRLGVPMIYGVDAVHGNNNAFKATIFPHNIGLGATRDPQLIRRIGGATALEVRATGISHAYAPCIAVCRDPRWGRCFESYGEDPKIVRSMTELVSGLQGEIPRGSRLGVPYVAGRKHVAACAKHFVGDGGTTRGINENNTLATWHNLLGMHMAPYYNSIIRGVSTIMVSYSSWNGVKMHTNRQLITGLLKGRLGFKGFVISDWQGIDRITDPPHSNYTYSILSSVNAGVDMVMVPYNYTEFIEGLTRLVRNGFIPTSRIDDAVNRILRVKFTMGLFEHPLADYGMAKYLGNKQHRELAREAVRKSLVLLKNGKSGGTEEPLIPLPKTASKILVSGTHANDIGNQCGGWTIEWHGKSGNITTGTTILDGIRNAVDPKTQIVFEENPDPPFVAAHNFSFAIVVVGEAPYSETAGDNTNLTLPSPGPAVVQNVCSQVKCVVVLVTGRPVVVEPYLDMMDGLVAAWLPGSEGQGVADVLFGDYGFRGKLPISWFRNVGQLPMNRGDEGYDPLFPLGFGLVTHGLYV